MAELTCPRGHELGPGGGPGLFCDEHCEAAVEAPAAAGSDGAAAPARTASAGAVHVTVAGRTIRLVTGDTVLIGRASESPMADVLDEGYPNVSREHVRLTAGAGTVRVVPRPDTPNGTWLNDQRLDAALELSLDRPLTLRLGSNCYLRIEVADE